jgi:heme-degrading monooxygenase HmoA
VIARIWTGEVRQADAETYADYIRETGFREYGETAGNRGAWLLRRDDGESTRFVALSMWDSLDAVRAFAGDDVEQAVFYAEDDRFLLERDETVLHYDVDAHAA